MDVNQASCCTVIDKESQSKFLCYTRRTKRTFSVCLTDAADVWSTDYTEDSLEQFRRTFALKSAEDFILKLRTACGTGDMSVVVQGSSVALQTGSSPADPGVTLSRLEGPRATAELRELLFRMADSLSQPGGERGSPSVSPAKRHQRQHAEFEPRQQRQRLPPSAAVKKRLAGMSLINPGDKKKVRATGVAFDDADD